MLYKLRAERLRINYKVHFMKRHVVLGFALAAASAGAFLAPVAQATIVPVNSPAIQFTNTGDGTSATRFTIGCGSVSGTCANLLEAAITSTSPVGWSSSFGLTLGGPSNASPKSETNYVSGLLGTSLTAGTGGNVSPSGKGNPLNFSFSSQYLLVKVGNTNASQGYALLQNISGGSLDLFFDAVGKGGGLSHYITFSAGSGTPVPEPGVLGMFGLGLLVLGAGYGLRRRRLV